MKPTICLDFDGVIHAHLSGWKGPAVIQDPPVSGAREAIKALRENCVIVVFSGRCASVEGRAAIWCWLKHHKIKVDGVTEHKPVASVFVDDRAVQFKGDWKQTIKDVHSFKQWQDEWKARRAAVRRLRRAVGR